MRGRGRGSSANGRRPTQRQRPIALSLQRGLGAVLLEPRVPPWLKGPMSAVNPTLSSFLILPRPSVPTPPPVPGFSPLEQPRPPDRALLERFHGRAPCASPRGHRWTGRNQGPPAPRALAARPAPPCAWGTREVAAVPCPLRARPHSALVSWGPSAEALSSRATHKVPAVRSTPASLREGSPRLATGLHPNR